MTAAPAVPVEQGVAVLGLQDAIARDCQGLRSRGRVRPVRGRLDLFESR